MLLLFKREQWHKFAVRGLGYKRKRLNNNVCSKAEMFHYYCKVILCSSDIHKKKKIIKCVRQNENVGGIRVRMTRGLIKRTENEYRRR